MTVHVVARGPGEPLEFVLEAKPFEEGEQVPIPLEAVMIERFNRVRAAVDRGETASEHGSTFVEIDLVIGREGKGRYEPGKPSSDNTALHYWIQGLMQKG